MESVLICKGLDYEAMWLPYATHVGNIMTRVAREMTARAKESGLSLPF